MLWGIEFELWCLLWWGFWWELEFLRIAHKRVFVNMQIWWHMACIVILALYGFGRFRIKQIHIILTLYFSRTHFWEPFLNFTLFNNLLMLHLKVFILFYHFTQLNFEIFVHSHDLLWWQFFLWRNWANDGLFPERIIRYHVA